MAYRAPVSEIRFWLGAVRSPDPAGGSQETPDDLVDAVLEEAGRFATDVVAPLDRIGDRDGARLENGVVRTPEGWQAAYRRWAEAGWGGLSADPDHGGQGLPTLVQAAVTEMWNGACVSFATGPMLTNGAVEAISAHGTDAQKSLYLPPLVEGRWMGTMNLTESQAGSDLSGLRTRAEPQGDGSYRIFGSKIFITYGDHDLTENIIHLVLARMPDAPSGTRGISLFLVPKLIPDADGRPGLRNDVAVAGVEHKMGLHGSPTCTMSYGETGGAIGWLVGEPHKGLAAMFTMMNNARLFVGLQGVGVAEAATQRAVAYALERRQGRPPGWTEPGPGPIALHPDVKRMLLTMRGLTDAARALCYAVALNLDLARSGPEEARAHHGELAALLTPVAKAFATDSAVEVASLGVQVHGGMGYIEETGAAQHLRDARILPIYEGTNGIQAIDLVTRKLTLQEGRVFRDHVGDLRGIVEAARRSGRPGLGWVADRVGSALDDLSFAGQVLGRAIADGRTTDALAGATSFLRLFALAPGGALHLKAATLDDGTDPRAAERRVAVASHFAAELLPLTGGLRAAATAGGSILDALDPALLSA